MKSINSITTPDEAPPPHQPPPNNKQEEHCSALAQHLLSHVKNLPFTSRAEVAKWCWQNIKVEIIWHANPINLVGTAGTKHCHLCAVERMVICHNFYGSRQKHLINLKSELPGVCSCKTRFLRFAQSGQEGGLWWGWGKAQKQSCCDRIRRVVFFWQCQKWKSSVL
jgi:hypothetical protein